MFTDAASLRRAVSLVHFLVGWYRFVPAVVVVPIDVEDLFAFNGEDSIVKLANAGLAAVYLESYPESTHSVKPGEGVRSLYGGVTDLLRVIPVPRTITSYSGAISSIFGARGE
jgi:hypothetical protein